MYRALMAVIASVSGLNVAQQELARAFDASQSTVLWFINAYTVALAALLMPIGAVGDRWGRKPVLLTGLVLFGIATLGGGLAPSATFMIVTRVLAGVGAAMIMPVTLSVITSSFPDDERSQAIGIWSGVAGGGGLIGMFASAALVDLVSWRWLFALPFALIAGAFITSVRSVPNSREDSKDPFDLGGSLLSMVGVGALVFAIHEGPEHGWTDLLTLVALVGGVIATIGFVGWELRQRAPLFDVRIFVDRRLASGSLSLLFHFGVLAGIFIVLFPFFQGVLGWSAVRSTLALLPMALVMMVASALAPRLVKRLGMRASMLAGIGVAAVGLVVMASSVSVVGGYVSVLPGMLVIGLGMGLTMTPSTEAITRSLPTEKQGVASALNDSTREFGSALGVALLGALLSSGYRGAITPHLSAFPDSIADIARGGIATALGVAPQAGQQAQQLISAAQNAFVEGWARSMWVGVAAMGLLFVYVFVRGPRQGLERAVRRGGQVLSSGEVGVDGPRVVVPLKSESAPTDETWDCVVVGTWDCVVVGGGAAGLSAALTLGRARLHTLVVDSAAQSNRVAAGIGGLLGYDGRPPAELYRAGWEELAAYPTVTVRRGTVVAGSVGNGTFALQLDDGSRVSARRVLLATGVDYVPPDLPGVTERWGRSVFHCPFCHAWELRDRPLGVLEGDVDRALLLQRWSDDVTLFANGSFDLGPEEIGRLEEAGVAVDKRVIRELRGPGTSLEAVVFIDGTHRRCEGLLVPASLQQRSDLAAQLGINSAELGLGPLTVDPMYRTNVAGVFAAGDLGLHFAPSVASAIAAGSTAAKAVVHDLVTDAAVLEPATAS